MGSEVPLYIPARPSDIFVACVVLLTQWPLVCFLLRDWKPRVSARAWYSVITLLYVVWTLAGTGLLLDIFAYRSPVVWLANLRTITIAIELAWGCLSLSAVLVYALYRAIAGRDPNRFSPARRRLIRHTAAAAMVAPFVAAGYGALIARTRFYVKEIDLPVPGLHPDLAGLRLVQISDLHVSAYLSVADAARVVDMANELRADIALVTGDIISDFGDPLEQAIRELGRLRATAGIFGCHGNHEIYARCQNLTSALCQKQGIRILRHEARILKFGSGLLNIAGVDFQATGQRKRYLRTTENLIVPGATNLLLSHSPDVFPAAVAKGFDAVLAGHTHGGQVTVEILNQTLNIARFATPFVSGLYRINSRSCYVTAGIGTIGMPIRLGAPPEITLLRLRPA